MKLANQNTSYAFQQYMSRQTRLKQVEKSNDKKSQEMKVFTYWSLSTRRFVEKVDTWEKYVKIARVIVVK